MKFPHLNLLFFIALLAFTSCEKEAIALPEPEPTEDASIGMRCCDQAVSDMLEDPRFTDFYDGFMNGIYDPIVGILDQYDNDQLEAEFEAFIACYEAGNSYEYCLNQSEFISDIINLLSSYDTEQLQSLLEKYDYLPPEELTAVLLDAINETAIADGRDLPCFRQFLDDVADAALAGGAVAIQSGGVPAALGIIGAILVARFKFCNCLNKTYGKGC